MVRVSPVSDDQTIRIRKFFGLWRLLRPVRLQRPLIKVNETGEVSKAWKITTVDFRVFQVLELSII